MFKIEDNQYLKSGMVKYIDEAGNKLMIITDKKGEIIRAKLRPALDIKVETISLKFPYTCNGLNFKGSAGNKAARAYMDTDEYYGLLVEAKSIIENWVDASSNIRLLVDSTVQLDEKTIEELLANICSYPETRDFATVYSRFVLHREIQKER